MPDEQETIVSPELEAPAIEHDEPEAVRDDNIAAPEEGEAEQPQEPEDDSEEFDWNGQKIRGPKGLKDSVLMHADYTRKTQEISEQKRLFQERETQLQQRYQQSDEERQARARLDRIEEDLQSYSGFSDEDWARLENDNPSAAQTAWRRLQQLQSQHSALTNYLGEAETARSAHVEQETANRLRETRDFAEKNIKGWSPEVDAKLTEFATTELGFDVNTLKGAYNPQIYKALHLAWVGAQALSKQPAKPAQPKAEPLKVVSAKANPPARKSYADMDMDEYAKARGFR